MTGPIGPTPTSGAPIPPPIMPPGPTSAPPPIAPPVVDVVLGEVIERTPADVLMAMMDAVETTTAAGDAPATMRLLDTLPADVRHSQQATYFGGLALLQQGRAIDAASLAHAALAEYPRSVPLLMLAATAESALLAPNVEPAMQPAITDPLLLLPMTGDTAPTDALAPATLLPSGEPEPAQPGTGAPSTATPTPARATEPPLSTTRLPMPTQEMTEAALESLPLASREALNALLTRLPDDPEPQVRATPAFSPPAEASGPLATRLAASMPDVPMEQWRPVQLLLTALDLAPVEPALFARIAAAVAATPERPLALALFRELQAATPAHSAVRTLATVLTGNAPPTWVPWARQVVPPGLWEIDGVPRVPASSTPAYLIALAKQLLAQGRPAQALTLLELPTLAPHPRIAMLRAEALLQLNRPAEALVVIEEALVQFPDAARPLQQMESRLHAVLDLPVELQKNSTTPLLLRTLIQQLRLPSPQIAANTPLEIAAMPLLDPETAQRNPIVLEARVRILVGGGRTEQALREITAALSLLPQEGGLARLERLLEKDLRQSGAMRGPLDDVRLLRQLGSTRAELPAMISLALLERLLRFPELPAMVDDVHPGIVGTVVDFRGPEGVAAAQWLAQFQPPPRATFPGGALLISAMAVLLILMVSGRNGLAAAWVALCVGVMLVRKER
ncbi:MAG: hypothetical protein ABIZ70_04995 [Gemmatimonadales bacterium]